MSSRNRLGNVLRRASLPLPSPSTRQTKKRRWMDGGRWVARTAPSVARCLATSRDRTAALRANHASVREQPCTGRGGGIVSKTRQKTKRERVGEGAKRGGVVEERYRECIAPCSVLFRRAVKSTQPGIAAAVGEVRDRSVVFVWTAFENDFLVQHLDRDDYSIGDFRLENRFLFRVTVFVGVLKTHRHKISAISSIEIESRLHPVRF